MLLITNKEITFKITNHAYVRDQQVNIYQNLCFVLKLTSFEFLTDISNGIQTKTY